MNYHVIFNALILLFILHIFLSNVDYHQIIGIPKKIENFGRQLGVPDNKEEDQKKMEYEQSLRFLQDNSSAPAQNDEDFKKKLLSFINKKDPNAIPSTSDSALKTFEDKNVYPVLPSNSFTSNVNVPNFESNVLNVQKFYKRNIEFDNLSENQLESSIKEHYTSSDNDSFSNERTNSDVVMKTTPIPNLSNDTNDSRSPYGRISTEQPPVWTYKNEMPMNGGSMGGIVGYDSLEGQFSLYSSGVMNMQPADSPNFKVIPHDDLRKPIKYED